MNISYYISPYFITRYYLRKDLSDSISKHKLRGDILDVGCGEKPYQNLFEDADSYIGIDFRSYSKNKGYSHRVPDVYFGKNYLKNFKLQFRPGAFDHCVSFQVLEHHPEPELMIREMARVTKKGGYILISAPFFWGIHEEPNDYYRFTEYSLRRLLGKHGLQSTEIKTQGSVASLLNTALTDYLIEIANMNKIFYISAVLLYPFLLAGSYLCILFDRIFSSKKLFLNYFVLAKKTR